MKSFAIVVGILGLIAGHSNAAAVATGQVLATRGEQVADTSILKSDKQVARADIFNGGEQVTDSSILKRGEPHLVQQRDYTAPMLEETEDKLAKRWTFNATLGDNRANCSVVQI
ncbi:hypothetical protein V500_01940 [Pseudogymnoascus sp. VKM F-4518 (FW-2643)]|nr:hypothetical protein V500_01940 [Pseudogymnoascus sp. VKM F-4518 (FW-2643)]